MKQLLHDPRPQTSNDADCTSNILLATFLSNVYESDLTHKPKRLRRNEKNVCRVADMRKTSAVFSKHNTGAGG